MNALDLLIVLAAVLAAIGGWRLGFLARLLGWIGIFLGLAVGSYFVPGVITRFGGTTPQTRATVALIFLVLVASAGQAFGLVVGLGVRRVAPAPPVLPAFDRAAGAAVGVAGVLAIVWMVTPALASARGWPAVAARDSRVVGWIQDVAPEQPQRLQAWARWIAEAPSVLDPLGPRHDPGPPPASTLSRAVDARVRPSTVKVVVQACGRIQEGSGWVAARHVVVTNAHVVAGTEQTEVETIDGTSLPADVVAFDPVRDLAVLSVPDLDARALPIAVGGLDSEGAVYGHPGGGGLEVSPARVGEQIIAKGTDIYHRGQSRRDVFVLAARLANGDSGAAFVNTRGQVIGVAFAIDPGDPATAYALTTDEVRPTLDSASSSPVDAGRCVAA